MTSWYIRNSTQLSLCQVCELSTFEMRAVNPDTGTMPNSNSETDFVTDVPLTQGEKLVIM